MYLVVEFKKNKQLHISVGAYLKMCRDVLVELLVDVSFQRDALFAPGKSCGQHGLVLSFARATEEELVVLGDARRAKKLLENRVRFDCLVVQKVLHVQQAVDFRLSCGLAEQGAAPEQLQLFTRCFGRAVDDLVCRRQWLVS